MVSRNGGNTFDMEPIVSSRSPIRSALKAVSSLIAERKDYVVGIALLLIVVVLWASSNFVTQDLFQGGYEKPFLVTYLNTSAFSLYLIPFGLKKLFGENAGGGAGRSRGDHQAIAVDPEMHDEGHIADLSPEMSGVRETDPPLTIIETIRLAFVFVFVWFAANWTVNASLDYTSVASATIMSSVSGFFTLGIGRLFRVETLSLTKIVAVVISFTGVIIVSLSDSTQSSTTALSIVRRAVLGEESSSPIFGDVLALSSAFFYAIYVILLKARIRSESRINMQLFFGFVGLWNIITCWPMGVVLHFTGAEKFELPSDNKAIAALLVNMFITFSSDFIYVIAMLKTTPLVVTVGLSLTIPVAVAGDFILNKPVRLLSLFGALLVLASFIVVGLEDSKPEAQAPVLEGRLGDEHEHVPLRLDLDDDP